MATTNSTGNLITMNATSDVARTTSKLKVAGVLAISNSATALPRVRLTNTAGTADIIPLAAAKSGALIVDHMFKPPLEVVGLKAVSCANVTIAIQLE